MKKNFLVVFLIAVVTTMMNLTALAVDESVALLTSPEYEINLIAAGEYEVNLISEAEENVVMPIKDTTIGVQLDGEYVDFTDSEGKVVNPQILNDRTMVPMRKIFEIFEAAVDWKPETRTVVATTEEKEITLTIDSDKANLKDLLSGEEKEITLDAAPVILNDRTMVPVRFIAESLEKEVGWDAANRTVVIIDFDKIEKELEEKVPALKDIFALELEPMEACKTSSKITGKVIYKDPTDKSNNETIKVNGTLEFNMNKEKEIEMCIDLEFTGSGTIYDSLKEAGMEELELRIIIADGSAYMMFKQDGKESWTNLGSGIDLSELTSLPINHTPKSYAEYVEIIKVVLEEPTVETYAMMEKMVDLLACIYNEENFKITGTGSNKTLKLNIDMKDFMNQYSTIEMPELLRDGKMTLSMVEKIANKKVNSAKITLETYLQEVDTKESIEMNFDIDMTFNSINKDFAIKLPKVTVE